MDTESDSPQGITSSADRMVGMEHSEVRYFTRYVILHRLGQWVFLKLMLIKLYSYDHHGKLS